MQDAVISRPKIFQSNVVRGLRRGVPAFIKGALRRQAGNRLPNREAREYQAWITDRVSHRASCYRRSPSPGLISVLTPVWDGSPLRYLSVLANSIASQNVNGESEWVILDNGCSNRLIRNYLARLSAHPWVKVLRSEANIGITAGLRACLERATGEYVLPVDADDFLYPDAFRVAASFIEEANFPALLYSDEDKINGSRFYQPYLKPGWDPVLLLNSAYIAHLGVIRRQAALELGAYTDPETEGSPDWDLFIRFMLAGHVPAHIPEVLYSWRVHSRSTADDAASKPYVHSSQRAVLQRFLSSTSHPNRFRVVNSPFLNGSAHWHLARQPEATEPIAWISVNSSMTDLTTLRALAADMAERNGMIRFVGADVTVETEDWMWEAAGLFELHPDTVMIGGRILNRQGTVVEAGHYFGVNGVYGDPNRGRAASDPGYFAQMWKQRSVSAASTQLAVARADFLVELLRDLPNDASLPFLGAWAGACASRMNKRVVYTPFINGVSDLDWRSTFSASEERAFADSNRDLIPDTRFYSPALCRNRPFALCLSHPA